MNILGISEAERIERVLARVEANMKGELEGPSNHKNMVTVTLSIYVTAGN